MTEYPHSYQAFAAAQSEGLVSLQCENCPELQSAAPATFGGPGDQWSPEDLLVGAVADCFVLSFRAIARMSKLDWTSLKCSASGTLDRVERSPQFTAFELTADLTVPEGTDTDRAQRLLEKAEQSCFITNSLKADSHLTTNITVG
jgi:peroxiredoxin-like protein